MVARSFRLSVVICFGLIYSLSGPLFTAKADTNPDWSALIEKAKNNYRPIDPEEVQAAKDRLQSTLRALETDLASNSPATELGWKKYLMVDELVSELQKEAPDIRVLQEAGSKFTGPHAGLERDSLRATREALKQFVILEFYRRDDRLEERIAVQLDRLAEDLELQKTEPSSELDHRIGATVGFLESIQQASDLVEKLRASSEHPNLQVKFSASFFRRALLRPVLKPGIVNQNILGTEVRGHSTTLGTVCIYPRDSYGDATFEICMQGNVRSSTIGRNGPATICSESNAPIAAWRNLSFDRDGFAVGPVNAKATSSTTITGLSTRPNFIRGMVMKRAMKSKPAAERIASARTRREVAEGFEMETNATVAKLQNKYVTEVLNPLRRHGQEPRLFEVSTTNDATEVSWFQANDLQIGSMTPAPAFHSEGDVSLRIHESAIRNFIESFFAGKSFGRDDLASIRNQVESPEPAETTNEKDPVDVPEGEEENEDFTFSLDPNLPVVINFRDDQLGIAVNIRRFQREGQAESLGVRIESTYDLSESDGGILLQRKGEPEVTFPGSKRLSVRQLTVKAFILKRIDKAMPAEIKTKGFLAPAMLPQLSALGRFRVSEATTSEGWLNLVWNIGK